VLAAVRPLLGPARRSSAAGDHTLSGVLPGGYQGRPWNASGRRVLPIREANSPEAPPILKAHAERMPRGLRGGMMLYIFLPLPPHGSTLCDGCDGRAYAGSL